MSSVADELMSGEQQWNFNETGENPSTNRTAVFLHNSHQDWPGINPRSYEPQH